MGRREREGNEDGENGWDERMRGKRRGKKMRIKETSETEREGKEDKADKNGRGEGNGKVERIENISKNNSSMFSFYRNLS